MAAATIERLYYSGETVESSEEFADMLLSVDLPPAPFIGMPVESGCETILLETIRWDADKQLFRCFAKSKFLGYLNLDPTDLDEQIKWLEKDGWKLLDRSKNENFRSPEESAIRDEEDREWDEIQDSYRRLTEAEKIEFHRRHDRALLVGSIAAKQRWMLDATRTRLAEKTSDAKKLTKWVWVFVALYALYSFVFPESKGGANWLLFATLGAMAVIFVRLNDDAKERIATEIVLLEESYRQSSVEWDMLTGMRLDKDKIEIEMASLGFGPDADLDKHYRSVRRSILSKLRNFQDSTVLRWS